MKRIPKVLAALVLAVFALPVAAIDVGAPLKFAPGNPKLRARLQVIPPLRELIAEPFAVALVDLNDDGNNELVVISRSDSFCGSGGCTAMVLEVKAGRVRVLLQQNLGESMGVTREKFGAYHALAAIDEKGAVQIADKPGTPLNGKPMVYPMAGAPGPEAPSKMTGAVSPASGQAPAPATRPVAAPS